MDDMTFVYDADQVAAGVRQFPVHRQTRPAAHPTADFAYLAADSAEFGRGVWDESGH